ncbi:MAG TPA: branched-chain amino acid ABC transporter permease, partial [Chloroflexota bacterium]|nr:branched-chain amino acid ABC transporter permease [Chloroflexota bacterium]
MKHLASRGPADDQPALISPGPALGPPRLLRIAANPWVATGGAGAVLILLGIVLDVTQPYFLFAAAQIAILVIAVLAQGLLAGYAGQPAFAGAAFYAVGAYTMAWSMSHHVFWLLCLAASLGMGLVAGLVAGLPAARVRGSYLVVISVSLVFITQDTLLGIQQSLEEIGSFVVARPGGIASDLAFYYFCAGLALAVVVLTFNLVRTRGGRALRALRSAEAVAAIFGINEGWTRTWIYMLNGLLTALAGALQALQVGSVNVTSFDLSLSVVFLAAVVCGGLGRLGGVLIGAILVGLLTAVLDDLLPSSLADVNLAEVIPVLLSALVIVMGWTR